MEQNRLTHKLGNFMTMDESAEIYLQRVKQAAVGIGYGEAQIRDVEMSIYHINVSTRDGEQRPNCD